MEVADMEKHPLKKVLHPGFHMRLFGTRRNGTESFAINLYGAARVAAQDSSDPNTIPMVLGELRWTKGMLSNQFISVVLAFWFYKLAGAHHNVIAVFTLLRLTLFIKH